MNDSKHVRTVFVYSAGKRKTFTVHDAEVVKLVSDYWKAVGDFLRTNDASRLASFADAQLTDHSGNLHTLEVRPNVLRPLAKRHATEFGQIYRTSHPNGNESRPDSCYDKERRKQRQFERLGTTDPRCIVCPENDPSCLELHHLAGRAFSDDEVIICRNDHRKVEDLKKDHPRIQQKKAKPLECDGKLILGTADLLSLMPRVPENLIAVLKRVGARLIEFGQNSGSSSEEQP